MRKSPYDEAGPCFPEGAAPGGAEDKSGISMEGRCHCPKVCSGILKPASFKPHDAFRRATMRVRKRAHREKTATGGVDLDVILHCRRKTFVRIGAKGITCDAREALQTLPVADARSAVVTSEISCLS